MRIKWYSILFSGLFLWSVQLSESAIIPQYGGTYRLAIPEQPTTFDPAQVTTPAERWIISNLYDGLVQFDNQNQPIPALARAWTTAPDGLSWTFYLRPSAMFHNGRTVTAEDVKFSIERLVNPAMRAPKSWLFSSISGYREYISAQSNQMSGIVIANNSTVQFRLLRPNPNFMIAVASIAASIVPQEEVANLENKRLEPVHSPFQNRRESISD